MFARLTALILAIAVGSPLCCCAHFDTGTETISPCCIGVSKGEVPDDGLPGDHPVCECANKKAREKPADALTAPERIEGDPESFLYADLLWFRLFDFSHCPVLVESHLGIAFANCELVDFPRTGVFLL